MKKYILSLMLLGVAFGCGPTDTQEEELRNLVSEWKNTSVRAVELSQTVGDKLYLLQSKKEAGESSEVMEITLAGESTFCETEYEQMAADVSAFIETWQEKSKEVDELTNSMSVGKWTYTQQESLEQLDLEVKQREVDIAQWEQDLEELNKKCALTADVLVIQEQES